MSYNLPEGWTPDKIEDELERQRNEMKDKYDFEPRYEQSTRLASETVIISAIEALCHHCHHSPYLYHRDDTVRCLQGRCDTLERIIGRLSDLDLGD